MRSLASTFDLVEPRFPRALISDRACARVRSAAAQLPAALSSCLYFECRASSPDQVDLIVDVDRAGREILASRNPAVSLGQDLLARPEWARVAAFARAWLEPGGALSIGVNDAWLEFDLDAGTEALTPSVFVDFSSEIVRGETAAVAAAIELSARHLSFRVGAKTASALSRCVTSLPAHAMVLYAGFMLARGSDAVRLCVMDLSRDELASFLHAMEWRGNVAAAADLMATLAHAEHGGQEQPAMLHIDVGAGMDGSIGLEYSFARQPQLDGMLAEVGLLDTLVSRGLLTSDQRAGLDAWPGFERRTMPHELWPSILVRRVNHVKLVLSGSDAPRAKAYLCAEHMIEHRSSPSAARTE